MRGQYIDTMMQGSYRAYIESLYNRLVDQRSPIYSVSTYDQRLLHTKRLMLPLSSDGPQVDMVMAAQVFIRPSGTPNTLLPVPAVFDPSIDRLGGESPRRPAAATR